MNKGTVWLTGGGTGIGKELAKILCDSGYDVIISGRRKEVLEEAAHEFCSFPSCTATVRGRGDGARRRGGEHQRAAENP